MPKPRLATNILEMNGAFQKNPKRAAERAGEPECVGELGDPPKNMAEDELECWHEVCSLFHAGTVGRSDYLAVEMLARLLAESRRSWTSFATADRLRLQSMLAAFGMTPADRSRVKVGKPKTVDPMEKLLAQKKA